MAPFTDIDDAAIAVLVRRFYGKVRDDAVLGPIFEGAVEDWEDHFQRLEAFWSGVMLTSGRYKGDPVGAHRPLPIEPSMFERWLGIWDETAGEVFEPEAAEAFRFRARRIAESLKGAIFFRRGQAPALA